MSSLMGNPLPASVFKGVPVIQNYNVTLLSKYLPTYSLTGCTDLYLEFDLKLDNATASGTELMTIILEHCGEPVDTLLAVDNSTGFNWGHYRMLINDGRGGSSRILFTASGQNSSNIQQWLLDNILVEFKCRPPVNLDAANQGDTAAYITWDPPECDMGTIPNWNHLTGYNMYMSDSSGNPPFTRCNASPITGEWYMHFYAPGWDPSVVRFYVTDLQHDSATLVFLCESEPSDTVSAHFVGIDPLTYTRCNIYPNPNDGEFTADLPPDALSVEISDLNSRVIYSEDIMQNIGRQFNIDISGHPKGIYILTVRTKSGISRGKIVLY
jgi:hypothetical protein